MPLRPAARDGTEVVTVRSAVAAILMLSMLALGSFAATSCGGRASAARSGGAGTDPPLAPVEPAVVHAASLTIAAPAGGTIAVTDPANPIAGAGIDLPPGALSADATITLDAAADVVAFPMFPDLTIVRAAATAPLAKHARVRIPYSEALLLHWNITDERQLVLYALDDDGLWGALLSSPDLAHHALEANIDRLTSWVVAPGWMLTAWQRRALVGDAFTPDTRNVLLVHGWNASPWDRCELQLAAAMRGTYDRVLAYAYPSALDIGDNAAWLRDAIAERDPGAAFDIIGFSEGGLVARAAVEPGAWNDGRTIAAPVRNLITIATPHLGILPDAGPSLLGDLGGAEMRSGSTFLQALNKREHQTIGEQLDTTMTPDASQQARLPSQGRGRGVNSPRYGLIAGGGWRDGSDGLVSADSALGRGVIADARTMTLPLVHATAGGGGMPCDAQVYEAIRSLVR